MGTSNQDWHNPGQPHGDPLPAEGRVAAVDEREGSEAERRGADHWTRPILSGWQYWLLTFLAVLGLGLVALNVYLVLVNQDMREDVAQRQHFINQTIQLSRLNTELVRALADASARTGDAALRDLLAAQGISFKVSPAADKTPPASHGDQSGGGEAREP